MSNGHVVEAEKASVYGNNDEFSPDTIEMSDYGNASEFRHATSQVGCY